MLGGFIKPTHIANFLRQQSSLVSGNIMDDWRAWLRSQGATGFYTHDLEIQWLRSQGYTGTFADMFYAKFGSRDGARAFFKGDGEYTPFASTTFLSATTRSGYLRKVELSGSSTQASTPTPDTPVHIVSTTGDVTVRSDSKNLFDNGTGVATGFYYDASGTPLPAPADYIQEEFIPVSPNTTYTMSTGLGSVLRILEYTSASVFIQRTITTTSSSLTITTTPNTRFIRISGEITALPTTQFELGTARTAYAPYQSVTSTLPLGTTQLRSLPNGVSDRIYKSGDSWYLEQNVNEHTLTESNVGGSDPGTRPNGSQFSLTAPFMMSTNNTTTNITSDRFMGVPFNDRDLVDNCIYGWYADNAIRINTTVATTREDLIDWITANPTKIYYRLSTPTTTEITDQTLITALENIRTYQGITNITASTPFSGEYPS